MKKQDMRNTITIICFMATGIITIFSGNLAHADSCFIFCVTQQAPPPYNATLIRELEQDKQKADDVIKSSFANDHLKEIWNSGKQITQFTNEEKLDLEIASKKNDSFNREMNAMANKVTDQLLPAYRHDLRQAGK